MLQKRLKDAIAGRGVGSQRIQKPLQCYQDLHTPAVIIFRNAEEQALPQMWHLSKAMALLCTQGMRN